MSQTQLINQTAQELTTKLQGLNDEQEIKTITLDIWRRLGKASASEGSLNRARTTLRKVVESSFPVSQTPLPGYYFTQAGKNKEPRYEHLALWYITTNEARYEIVGDEARKQYWGNLPELTKPESKDLSETPINKSKAQTMSIGQLEIDDETKNIILNAANHTGLEFSAFVAEACRYYAKTIMGRAKQNDEELSAIPTKELLENSKYNTHPGRPEELVKRAIQAIKIHNGNVTEKSQKWMITQSLLMQLTGSRADKIKSLISEGGRFHQEISDINASLIYNYALDDKGIHLFNRKGGGRKPEEEIKLCELVSDGIG